jgi:hypothetical protein
MKTNLKGPYYYFGDSGKYDGLLGGEGGEYFLIYFILFKILYFAAILLY